MNNVQHTQGKQVEPEARENLIASIPMVSWDEFMAMPDEAKIKFVDTVRKAFGPVVYSAFQLFFDSHMYWFWERAAALREERKRGNLDVALNRARNPLYVEPGTRPSLETVTKEMKRLGYRWKQTRFSPRQREEFDQWRKEAYRFRADKHGGGPKRAK